MAERKVTLLALCKTEIGWRRFAVPYGKNGRPKPGVVLVDGVERSYPELRYQVRHYEDRKPVYKNVGAHVSDANAALKKQAQVLAVVDAAEDAGVKLAPDTGRLRLATEYPRFLQATLDRGSKVAHTVYKEAVREFLPICGKTFADELTAEDVLRYRRALRDRGLADRTIFNRHRNLLAFLRWLKLDLKAVAPSQPKFEKRLPVVYEPEELRQFFASLERRPSESLAYEIMLKCGLRDQEAIYLEWRNVFLDRAVMRIRGNPKYGFKVKDSEERDIPIPANLLAHLQADRAARPLRTLVTGTKTDKPNQKLLRTLKRLVNQAGLACGVCPGCITQKECEHWFLHKFRATCITTLLRSGMDLRTVMKFSGHADLASVMRYLAPASDDAIHKHIAAIHWM